MNEYLDLIQNRYRIKKQKVFNWARFYHFLAEIIDRSYEETNYNTSLGETIEVFFIITDLIDDLMDKDKEEVNVLKEKHYLVEEILGIKLEKLKTYVSQKQYNNFINYIKCSLHFQCKEVNYQINKDSNEKEYFELVKRSTYLVQSIAFLVDEDISNEILTAIEYYAISSQIVNDLNDLRKDRSYDVLDKKGTLPIIKTWEVAKENKDLDFIKKYKMLSRACCTTKDYQKIINYIQHSGAIEYCQLVAFYYHKKAKFLFVREVPSKKVMIKKYFDSLWR